MTGEGALPPAGRRPAPPEYFSPEEGPEIRPARPEDDEAIWDILRPIIEAGDTLTADPRGGREGAFAYWRPAGAENFVAQSEGRVMGTYYLRPNHTGAGSHVCNAGFATAGAARGRGVARAMLAHALAEARARGYRAMQFNFVVASNTRAVDTWVRAGFDIVGRLPGAFRHPELGYVDALVMMKNLTGEEDAQ